MLIQEYHVSYNRDTKNPTTLYSRKAVAILERALTVAALSECNQKHAAIINSNNGNTLAVATNTFRNPPRNVSPEHIKSGCTVHAEMRALKLCKKTDLTGATVFIVRVSAQGTPLFSRPCNACYTALMAAGITEIIHT